MQTWRDYITRKFVPTDQFVFISTPDSLVIKHNKSGTSFSFYPKTSEWKTLADVQYHNEKTKGWSGEYKEAEYNTKELELLDSFLAPAFEDGWISQDIYIGKKHWKSIVYYNPNMVGPKFEYYSSAHGFLSVLLFPIYYFWALLFGQKRLIKISPVN